MLAVRDVVATAHRTDVLNETNEPPKARSGWHAAEVHRFSSTVRPVLYRPESKRLPSCVHARAAHKHLEDCKRLIMIDFRKVQGVPPALTLLQQPRWLLRAREAEAQCADRMTLAASSNLSVQSTPTLSGSWFMIWAAQIERINCRTRPLPRHYSSERMMDLHHLAFLWHIVDCGRLKYTNPRLAIGHLLGAEHRGQTSTRNP